MAKFESKGNSLYIDGKRVIKAWKSYSGWYWFAVERVQTQNTMINGKVYEDDIIWYGLVQGLEEEWGDFSQAEIESSFPKVWEINQQDLPFAGRQFDR